MFQCLSHQIWIFLKNSKLPFWNSPYLFKHARDPAIFTFDILKGHVHELQHNLQWYQLLTSTIITGVSSPERSQTVPLQYIGPNCPGKNVAKKEKKRRQCPGIMSAIDWSLHCIYMRMTQYTFKDPVSTLSRMVHWGYLRSQFRETAGFPSAAFTSYWSTMNDHFLLWR